MKKRWKKIMALTLGSALAVTAFTGCGKEDSKETGGAGGDINTVGKSTDFTFLISNAITQGYYDDYDDNPIAQWWTDQEWDADGDGTGTKLNIDFWAPTAGAEKDYVNNLISTQEYPDVLPLTFTSEGATAMYEEGMILDLTAYIDAYMPNYKAYMEAHPEFLYTNRVGGEDKYIQLYITNEDYNAAPWGGMMYRRDWIVNYGTNPETGDAFTGEWKDGEWVDDVVFPSGNTDPVYVSDWEWMFEIFANALQAQGMADGYVMQLPYQGVNTSGDIASGFNTGVFLKRDADGKVVLGADSEGFRAYVECMANWYGKGWIDPAFAERSGDMFFMIDMASVYSGQVGLWYGLESQLMDGLAGDGTNPWTAGAGTFAVATPINDVYGDAAYQNVEPDLFYQDALLSQAFVITDKAADKDLATLLTAIDYFYSEEGSTVFSYGLSDKMLKEAEGTPYYDFYMSLGLANGAYVMDGKTIVRDQIAMYDSDIGEVSGGRRMIGMSKMRDIDFGYSETKSASMQQWLKYKSTAGILMDVTGQLTSDELKRYNAFHTDADTCIAQWIPEFITGKRDVKDDSQWKQYTDEIQALNPDAVIESVSRVLEGKN